MVSNQTKNQQGNTGEFAPLTPEQLEALGYAHDCLGEGQNYILTVDLIRKHRESLLEDEDYDEAVPDVADFNALRKMGLLKAALVYLPTERGEELLRERSAAKTRQMLTEHINTLKSFPRFNSAALDKLAAVLERLSREQVEALYQYIHNLSWAARVPGEGDVLSWPEIALIKWARNVEAEQVRHIGEVLLLAQVITESQFEVLTQNNYTLIPVMMEHFKPPESRAADDGAQQHMTNEEVAEGLQRVLPGRTPSKAESQ